MGKCKVLKEKNPLSMVQKAWVWTLAGDIFSYQKASFTRISIGDFKIQLGWLPIVNSKNRHDSKTTAHKSGRWQ